MKKTLSRSLRVRGEKWKERKTLGLQLAKLFGEMKKKTIQRKSASQTKGKDTSEVANGKPIRKRNKTTIRRKPASQMKVKDIPKVANNKRSIAEEGGGSETAIYNPSSEEQQKKSPEEISDQVGHLQELLSLAKENYYDKIAMFKAAKERPPTETEDKRKAMEDYKDALAKYIQAETNLLKEQRRVAWFRFLYE